MPNHNELVSIFLSTYNGERYLEETIQSVLRQSLSDFVFRILDDGSSDGTWSILQKFAELDSRIQIERNSQNRGTGYCYSRLMSNTRGEFVAAIGQDDQWGPDYLDGMVRVLSDFEECSVAVSNVFIIDADGKRRPDFRSPFQGWKISQLDQEELLLELLRGNFLCAAGAVFRRESVRGWETLGYNDQFQDWSTWLYLSVKGSFKYLEDPYVEYRIHGSNLSLGSHSPVLVEVDLRQSLLHFLEKSDLWLYVIERPDSDKFFNRIMETLIEVTRHGTSEDWFVLLYSLRKNAAVLESLPSFSRWLGILYFRQGAVAKGRTLLGSSLGDFMRPRLREKLGLKWRYFFYIARPSMRIDVSDWQKTKKIGCLGVSKALLASNVFASGQSASLVGVTLDIRSKSLDRLIERALVRETRSLYSLGWRVFALVKEKKWKTLRALKEKIIFP